MNLNGRGRKKREEKKSEGGGPFVVHPRKHGCFLGCRGMELRVPVRNGFKYRGVGINRESYAGRSANTGRYSGSNL
jgi:hypothetical protein